MTKLIFMGTPDFSATVLKGLLTDDRYEILAVVTQPDRAVGRKKVIQETPVNQAAKEAGGGQGSAVDDVHVVGGAGEGDEQVADAVAEDLRGLDEDDGVKLEALGGDG